ncbi:unnamed protein product [Mytilus edulis]|uniref:Uncharacterized protein n=1 Tax=Mytilus edulis TaxID=6550 RepID=A0A8S3UXK4_MYTED|nr:unnamed protein product [Mytilus edulis]
MAMSTQQEERDHFTVSGFCEAILKRENKEEQKSEKDEDITEIMNKEEKKPEMGVDISTEQRREMKKIEKKRVKDEKKKVFQASDVAQEKQNDLTTDKTIDIDGEQQNGFRKVKANEETENDEDEMKKTDQTIDVEKNKTETDTERIEEQTISCDGIGKNEVKENFEKDTKDIKTSTNNAEKKTTFAARISGFFRSLLCIKGQKKSKDVC